MFGSAKITVLRPILRFFLGLALLGVATSGWAAPRSRPQWLEGEPYRPCPAPGSACRVLPLGDSITTGIGYEGGYRLALFERARAAGQAIVFTGSQQNGPLLSAGRAFPRHHEGHSGWTIEQIMTTVPRPALSGAPHIVLLHVGTNDLYAHTSTAIMVEDVEILLERIEAAAPRALIAVADIIPLTDPELCIAAQHFNQQLTQRVQARQARGEHVIVVDQFSDFSTSLLGDGVHPTRAGYERMADVWYSAIAPYLR